VASDTTLLVSCNGTAAAPVPAKNDCDVPRGPLPALPPALPAPKGIPFANRMLLELPPPPARGSAGNGSGAATGTKGSGRSGAPSRPLLLMAALIAPVALRPPLAANEPMAAKAHAVMPPTAAPSRAVAAGVSASGVGWVGVESGVRSGSAAAEADDEASVEDDGIDRRVPGPAPPPSVSDVSTSPAPPSTPPPPPPLGPENVLAALPGLLVLPGGVGGEEVVAAAEATAAMAAGSSPLKQRTPALPGQPGEGALARGDAAIRPPARELIGVAAAARRGDAHGVVGPKTGKVAGGGEVRDSGPARGVPAAVEARHAVVASSGDAEGAVARKPGGSGGNEDVDREEVIVGGGGAGGGGGGWDGGGRSGATSGSVLVAAAAIIAAAAAALSERDATDEVADGAPPRASAVSDAPEHAIAALPAASLPLLSACAKAPLPLPLPLPLHVLVLGREAGAASGEGVHPRSRSAGTSGRRSGEAVANVGSLPGMADGLRVGPPVHDADCALPPEFAVLAPVSGSGGRGGRGAVVDGYAPSGGPETC